MSESQFDQESGEAKAVGTSKAYSCVSADCEFDEHTRDYDLDKAIFGMPEDRDFKSFSESLSFTIKRFTQAGVVMEVTLDHHLCRPSPIGWILNGGTSLALAEVSAGLASFALCPMGSHPVGSAVSANHTSMAQLGEKLVVKATALHVGKTTHVVNVDITGQDGRLVSTARVTNTIISPTGTEGSAHLQKIAQAQAKAKAEQHSISLSALR